jgi:hypothetical protein
MHFLPEVPLDVELLLQAVPTGQPLITSSPDVAFVFELLSPEEYAQALVEFNAEQEAVQFAEAFRQVQFSVQFNLFGHLQTSLQLPLAMQLVLPANGQIQFEAFRLEAFRFEAFRQEQFPVQFRLSGRVQLSLQVPLPMQVTFAASGTLNAAPTPTRNSTAIIEYIFIISPKIWDNPLSYSRILNSPSIYRRSST